MINAIAVGSLFLSLLASAGTPVAEPAAEDAAAPGGVTVELVTVNGSGCSSGAGAAALSADRNTILLTMPAYFAAAGGDAGATEFRRNCQAALEITKPAGVTFAVNRVTASGFVYLTKGATGRTQTSMYFQGQAATTVVARTFTGPLADEWATSDTVSPPVYAPCDGSRLLNINTEVRVSPSNSDDLSSFMVRDPQSTYRLSWKKC